MEILALQIGGSRTVLEKKTGKRPAIDDEYKINQA